MWNTKFATIGALAIAIIALAVALYHWHNGNGKVHLGSKA